MLELQGLSVHFPSGRGRGGAVRAVDGVDLHVRGGETLGLVGESGCGKSTLARAVVRLIPSTGGSIRFRGEDITTVGGQPLRTLRREIRIVFQDPYGSLNPRMRVGDIVAQPLRIHRTHQGRGEDERVAQMFELVGLDPALATRYPHEFSGGQRQRIGIARALSLDPSLVVLDEPVSALDVSIQAQILTLLRRLQTDLGVSYLFISHDLAVVRHLADRVAVMYLGKIVEVGQRDEIFADPQHPYTRALLSAVPRPNPSGRSERRRIRLTGEPPDPSSPPSGCRFRTRCWKADERCAEEEPVLVGPDEHRFACHHPG